MLNNIKWQGNSLKMFNFIISKIPKLFKIKVIRYIDDYVVRNNIFEITEQMVLDSFKEFAPEKYYNAYIEELKSLRSENHSNE